MNKPAPLLANMSSLFVIQFASYLVPLMLLPYLSRVLGVETFGVVAFGLSIIAIGGIITDFGFDLYAPYHISKNLENQDFIREISGEIFAGKLILYFVVVLLMMAFAFFSEKYDPEFILLLIFPILGHAMQPNWFFQGIQKVREITWYFILSRGLYAVLVVSIVKSPEDYRFVVISLGIALLFNSLLSVRKMKLLGFMPKFPNILQTLTTLHGATGYFYSRASSATYSAGGVLFLGIFATNVQVAHFSAAEQLFRGMQGIFTPISLAIYPYMTQNKNKKVFLRVMLFGILSSLLLVLAGVAMGKQIVQLIFGSEFGGSYAVLVIFCIVLAVNVPSTLIGYPYLGAMGLGSYVNFTVIVAGVIQLSLLFILYAFDFTTAIYVAACILLAELTILILRLYKCSMFAKKDRLK